MATAKTSGGKTKAKKTKAKRGKKADSNAEPSNSASAIVTELKARYPGKIFRGSEYTSPWMLKRLPTGIAGLDIDLNGGFPAGGFVMIYGPEGIGKNFIANCVAAQQQKIFGKQSNIAFVTTEMVYDKSFGKACDVMVGFSEQEIEFLEKAYFDGTGLLFDKDYKEHLRKEVGTVITVPPSTAEDVFDIVLDLVSSRQFDLVVVDSFGSLLTEEDDDKDMNEGARVGGSSLVNTRFARKLNSAFAPADDGRPNLTCVVGINQVRDVMDRANKYSPKIHEGGGWALKHARWVGVLLTKAGSCKTGDKKVGKVVRWVIEKQKAGGHEGGMGTYDFIWDRVGVWIQMETLRAAVDHGVVDKKGSFYSYKGEKLGQGMHNAAQAIEDAELNNEIYSATLAAAGVHCVSDFKFDG